MNNVILFISICSPILPILLGIRKKQTLLWLYAVIGFAFDVATFLLTRRGIATAWADNIFCIIEFLLICYYYKPRIFRSNRVFYVVVGVLVLPFIIATLYNLIWVSLRVFNSYGEAVFDLTCIVFALLGLYTMLKEQKNLFIEQSSFFWFNIALLLYSSGNFLIYLFQAYLLESQKSLFYALWVVHNVLNIIFSVLLAISLSRKKP